MQRIFPLINFVRHFRLSAGQFAKFDPSKHYTVVAKSGVVVSWHPVKKFPYEHTRPLPVEEKTKKPDSVLQDQLLLEHRDRYTPKGPSPSILREFFHVDSQEFLPRPREKRLYATIRNKKPYREGI